MIDGDAPMGSGQRISGQYQGQQNPFSAQKDRRHDRTHDRRNAKDSP
jgi:hypothetical protein